MDDEKLKRQIGANIASYRKRSGLTQLGLAERLNYSDKAVSKWERGESVPDVITLVQLAEQFDIAVNDLLVDPDELPGNPNNLEQAMTRVTEKTLKRKANKHIILWLSSLLVWFVALFLYVMVSSFDIPYSWVAFLYAIPANAIVLLSMRSAWHDFRWNRFYISATPIHGRPQTAAPPKSVKPVARHRAKHWDIFGKTPPATRASTALYAV